VGELEQVLVWIWDSDNSHRKFFERIRASLGVLRSFPQVLRFHRFSAADVRRVPILHRARPECSG
jgi:hypothetical protein